MKRSIAFLLCCLLLCLFFASCGNRELTDGTYTMDVTLSGGSGRASVQSPAAVTLRDGRFTAVVVWSSPFYEYMLVDGVRYEPIQTEGNSTFCIPIVPDTHMAVSASTVAMSQPHLIEYDLFFDSTTAKGA